MLLPIGSEQASQIPAQAALEEMATEASEPPLLSTESIVEQSEGIEQPSIPEQHEGAELSSKMRNVALLINLQWATQRCRANLQPAT